MRIINDGFDVNTNKFTVESSTGNTTVAGTLEVTGTSTLTGALMANGGATIDNIQIGITANNEIDLLETLLLTLKAELQPLMIML